MANLYTLYTTDSNNLYSEYSTNIVLTVDKVSDMLSDEGFNDVYGHGIHFEHITGYKLSDPDKHGNINLTIQYVWEWDLNTFEEIVFCLVPAKTFVYFS